jgi:hypothetical protein
MGMILTHFSKQYIGYDTWIKKYRAMFIWLPLNLEEIMAEFKSIL